MAVVAWAAQGQDPCQNQRAADQEAAAAVHLCLQCPGLNQSLQTCQVADLGAAVAEAGRRCRWKLPSIVPGDVAE